MTVVLATRNEHKLRELRRILADAELDIDLIDVPEAERRTGVEVPEITDCATGIHWSVEVLRTIRRSRV